MKKDKAAIALLLKHNANLNLKNNAGLDTLEMAGQYEILEFVHECLENQHKEHSFTTFNFPLFNDQLTLASSRLIE